MYLREVGIFLKMLDAKLLACDVQHLNNNHVDTKHVDTNHTHYYRRRSINTHTRTLSA